MEKNRVQWIVGWIVLTVLLLLAVVDRPAAIFRYNLHVMLLATFLNAAVFTAGYSLLKPLQSLAFWKFAVYVVIVSGINFFFYNAHDWTWSYYWTRDLDWFFEFVLPFGLSLLLNIGFLRYILCWKARPAILLGLVVGLTNAQSTMIGIPVIK